MKTPATSWPAAAGVGRCAIIGRGRLGSALAAALPSAGIEVDGPHGRGSRPSDEATLVLLCVPDAAIAEAADALPAREGRTVAHCSGATGLDPVAAAGHLAASLHPLMTVPASGADFTGAGAAVDGATPTALAAVTEVAAALGMVPARIADGDRTAYHAAASIASNYLVALEAAAERVLATTGASRELLVPLVRATVDNWAAHGPDEALTGPIARGDEATVARQRAVVAERAPDLLPLVDALAEATRALAGRRAAEEAAA